MLSAWRGRSLKPGANLGRTVFHLCPQDFLQSLERCPRLGQPLDYPIERSEALSRGKKRNQNRDKARWIKPVPKNVDRSSGGYRGHHKNRQRLNNGTGGGIRSRDLLFFLEETCG